MSSSSPTRSTRTAVGWWSATATTSRATVVTSAGAVEVQAPRVNDKRVDPETGERQRFSSAILPAWARSPRRSPRCCRCCTCTACPAGDFAPALEQFLGTGAGLSAASITRLTDAVAGRGQRVRRAGPVGCGLCVPVGRRHPPQRRLDEEKLCLLVMIGVRADGRKELVALTDGLPRVAPSRGPICCVIAAAAACAPRCWPSGTGRWDSGARCARCSRRPASSVAGSITPTSGLCRRWW